MPRRSNPNYTLIIVLGIMTLVVIGVVVAVRPWEKSCAKQPRITNGSETENSSAPPTIEIIDQEDENVIELIDEVD